MSGRDDADGRRKKRSQEKVPPGATVPKVALSYDEAAWSLGISRSKLYRLVSEGRLACVELGGNTVLRPADLEKFVDARVKTRGMRKDANRDVDDS